MTSIITHELLYEILLKEKNRNELQKIEENFFQQLYSYIKEKELILESQKNKNSFPEEIKKTEKQLQSIKHLLAEIVNRRKRKILDLSLLNSRTPQAIKIKNLLPKEQKLYDSALTALNKYSLPVEAKALKNENPPLISVTFLSDLPAFVGTDNKIYGPFKTEDSAQLPLKTANILINKNKARKNETA